MELDRDGSLYPEGNLIEWRKTTNFADVDGLEIKRRGDCDVNARISILLDHIPEKYKVSPVLQSLLDLKTATRGEIVTAMWQYIKVSFFIIFCCRVRLFQCKFRFGVFVFIGLNGLCLLCGMICMCCVE